MNSLILPVPGVVEPEAVAQWLRREPGLVLLRSHGPATGQARYSFLTARPFLVFRARGTCCECVSAGRSTRQFGNPWHTLDTLLARYELLEEPDLPFPLGGAFGYWGYDLGTFLEPRVGRKAMNDLEVPDCHVGFHDSLVAFDHQLGRTWILSTGLEADGTRSARRARVQADFWLRTLASAKRASALEDDPTPALPTARAVPGPWTSSLDAAGFRDAVRRAQTYIRAGDIYQVNLSQRLTCPAPWPAWSLFRALCEVSPAPFAAYLTGARWALASSSPELFLRLSGAHVLTRPIKGTRPRALDPTRDAQLAYELQTSPKETAELVMITDLLRNDLGRVCEFGSVQVPELMRLERFAQVQHLVSTVEGRLRPDVTHLGTLAACFPGGSITGAPKVRAMQIIDELEPVTRGPYTGAHGYLGFNRESQLSITIRSALCLPDRTCFHVGAGIVADSDPEAEHAETLAKAGGFAAALERLQLTRTSSRTAAVPSMPRPRAPLHPQPR